MANKSLTIKSKAPNPAITIEEIEEVVTRIQSHVESARVLMLYLFESRAHKVAGFARWPDFCAAKFNVQYTPNYHSDVLRAARIEREIITANPNAPRKSLKVRTLIRIAKHKTTEERLAAYEQANNEARAQHEENSRHACPQCCQALEALRKVIRSPRNPDDWRFEVEQAISALWKSTEKAKPSWMKSA